MGSSDFTNSRKHAVSLNRLLAFNRVRLCMAVGTFFFIFDNNHDFWTKLTKQWTKMKSQNFVNTPFHDQWHVSQSVLIGCQLFTANTYIRPLIFLYFWQKSLIFWHIFGPTMKQNEVSNEGNTRFIISGIYVVNINRLTSLRMVPPSRFVKIVFVVTWKVISI